MKGAGKAYIGVDIGTSSIAGVAVDGGGRTIAARSAANPCAGEPDGEGRHEQDADAVLRVAEGVLGECERAARAAGLELAGVGWTGQMHGLVGVDEGLRAVTPFVTWRDARCAPPKLGAGVMEDWAARGVKGIWRALTIAGYAVARRTGRCVADRTFWASMGAEEDLRRFAGWLPERDDSLTIGDNQAGVYAAVRMHPGAAVVNIGTSGQFSRVRERAGAGYRPFPGGKWLECRASHVGGAALAKLRRELGWTWERVNAEAERDGRVRECVERIVGDLAEGADMEGVGAIVGIGTALRLNGCLKRAVERRFGVECIIPEEEEPAALGAALYVLDRDAARNATTKQWVITETLRREIQLGKYAVNERFPSEHMLMRRFKVARATVTSALGELKREGVIRSRQGSGSFVTPAAVGKGAIGLIVPGRGRGEIFEPVCRAIEKAAGELGYAVETRGTLKGSAEERKEALLEFAGICARRHVAGAIVEPMELAPGKDETTEEILGMLDEMNIPVVLIDRDTTGGVAGRRKYDLVGIDNFGAGYRLGKMMAEAGARRVAFLHFRESAPTVRRRICGVAQAALDAGLRWGRGSVIELKIGDARGLGRIFAGERRPDALVCANDRTAAFAMQTLSAVGLRVPGDVRVAGFDDLEYARQSKVPLTTVRQPCEELGRVAVHTLVERILHQDFPVREIVLAAEVVRRESV